MMNANKKVVIQLITKIQDEKFDWYFQIEKFEKDIDGYTNEIRLLHQQTQKFEKQLANTHANNELLQKTLQQNEASYREKVKFFH